MVSVKSNREFTLVPLDCPSCGGGMAADGDDVVFYCTACRNGYRFDPLSESLQPIEVSFVALARETVELYRPFWLLPARITIHERRAKAGGFSGLMSLFLGPERPPAERDGTFAVPAFHSSLASVADLSRRYTEALPELGEKLGERLLGGCYGVGDAHKLAHYVLIASEVERPDTLTGLRYEIDFGTPRLLGVPFVHRGDGLQDAIFGIAVGSGGDGL